MTFDNTKNDPGLKNPDSTLDFLVGIGKVSRPGTALDVTDTVGAFIKVEDDPLPKQILFSIATLEGKNVHSGYLPTHECSNSK